MCTECSWGHAKSLYGSVASKKTYNDMRVLKDEKGNLHENMKIAKLVADVCLI